MIDIYYVNFRFPKNTIGILNSIGVLVCEINLIAIW